MQIQYSKVKGNHRIVTSDYLGGVASTLRTYKCGGVKVCAHLDDSLRIHHSEVLPEWTDRIGRVFQHQTNYATAYPDRDETESYFQYISNRHHCLPHGLCSGNPKLVQSVTVSLYEVLYKFC